MHTLTHPEVLAPKAGASVAIALVTVHFFGLHDSLSATFVALVCTSPAIVTGIRRGLEQLVASLAGGLVTSFLLELLPRHPLTLALALAVSVLMAFSARVGQAYIVAGFTVLYVYILPASSPEQALGNRLLSLSVGVGAATIVNLAVGALFAHRIYERRMRILRAAVRGALVSLVGDAPDQARHALAPTRFDPVFPLIWMLGSELADTRAEARIRPSLERELAGYVAETQALARLTHYAKGLAMHLDEPGSDAIARGTERVIEALDGRAGGPFDPGLFEWSGLLRRAREAAIEAAALRAQA